MLSTRFAPSNRATARTENLIDDCDGARPSCGCAADLYRQAAHCEAVRWQALEIVKFLNVTVADLTARFVAFPDETRVLGGEILVLGMDEGRIPAPSVGAGHPHALAQEMQCRVATHAATLRDIVRATISRACAGV